jgi:hypothetical protein
MKRKKVILIVMLFIMACQITVAQSAEEALIDSLLSKYKSSLNYYLGVIKDMQKSIDYCQEKILELDENLVNSQISQIKNLESLILAKNVRDAAGDLVNFHPIDRDSLSKLNLVDDLLPEKNLDKSYNEICSIFVAECQRRYPYRQYGRSENGYAGGDFFLEPTIKLYFWESDTSVFVVFISKKKLNDKEMRVMVYKGDSKTVFYYQSIGVIRETPNDFSSYPIIYSNLGKRGVEDNFILNGESEAKKLLLYFTALAIIRY